MCGNPRSTRCIPQTDISLAKRDRFSRKNASIAQSQTFAFAAGFPLPTTWTPSGDVEQPPTALAWPSPPRFSAPWTGVSRFAREVPYSAGRARRTPPACRWWRHLARQGLLDSDRSYGVGFARDPRSQPGRTWATSLPHERLEVRCTLCGVIDEGEAGIDAVGGGRQGLTPISYLCLYI